MNRRWWQVLRIGLGLLLSVPVAEAALSVGPSRVELHAKPGQTLVGYFTLENHGEDPVAVAVEPEDWSQGIGGERQPVDWLTVRPAKLTLKPGQRTRVKYLIRVPKQASGELRTQVFFTTVDAEASMSIRSRLGTIVYVGIEGTEQIAGAITRVEAFYTASTPGAIKPDRLDLAIGIKNLGSVHLVPQGAVEVRDAEGHKVTAISIQGGWGLLPNEEDRYHAIEHGLVLKPGRYTLEVTVILGGDLRHPVTTTKTVGLILSEEGSVRITD